LVPGCGPGFATYKLRVRAAWEEGSAPPVVRET
jgi:hypothetical protein